MLPSGGSIMLQLCHTFGKFASNSKHTQNAFKNMRLLQIFKTRYTTVHQRQIPRTKPSKTNMTYMIGTYTLLTIPVLTLGLGTWQIYRRGWKLDLIEQLNDKTKRQPVPLPDDLAELDSMEFTPVKVRGHFDHNREFHQGPKTHLHEVDGASVTAPQNKVGFMVITPFVLADRPLTILVNRGWVPKKLKDASRRPAGQIEGQVEFVGLVRSEDKHDYGVAAIADNNTFIWRDIKRMARYAGADEVFIDADSNSTVEGGPIGGQTPVTLRNEHFNYVVIWYSIALITSYMWYQRFKRPPLPDTARIYKMYKNQR